MAANVGVKMIYLKDILNLRILNKMYTEVRGNLYVVLLELNQRGYSSPSFCKE